MRAILFILLLASALAAQSRTTLDSKYGPPEGDRYRIKPGIVVEASFLETGKVKTLRIVPDDPEDKNALLRAEDVRNVIRELAPGRLCRRPLKYTEIKKLPCPPRKGCRGVQEEWKRATTLMVRHKKGVVYSLVTLSDESVPPPGHIKLLPGYEHMPLCGIDTVAGYIRKEGGLGIGYDIGEMAGNFAMIYAHSDVAEWTKTEQFSDDKALIVLTKQNYIVATFEKSFANFSATVSSKSEIDDFLRIVLTYKPK
ncbi:MAG: hypothetical protein IPM21_11190 [Acidobacteria bacterium]|nr:hypothetical protein [Acidobacteriota bacterium]